jgi:hypothetical protein
VSRSNSIVFDNPSWLANRNRSRTLAIAHALAAGRATCCSRSAPGHAARAGVVSQGSTSHMTVHSPYIFHAHLQVRIKSG